MSDECNRCGMNSIKIIPIQDGLYSCNMNIPLVRLNHELKREEHEAIIKDSHLCIQKGIDQHFEIMAYLKRWGGWLRTSSNPVSD